MENALFKLLRLGLQNRSVEEEDLSDLLTLSESEWEELAEVAKRQGVMGVVLDGINAILKKSGRDAFDHFEDRRFWRRFIVKWAMTVEQSYEGGNQKQLAVIDDIQKRWSKVGIRMMIMKGMAMGTYYPVSFHRAPGDIDCYLFDDYAKGNELAKEFPADVDEGWYKHSQIHYRGQLIENHLFFVHTREGKSSKELNQLMVDALKNGEFEKIRGTDALLPPPLFNALFLTYHAMTHFLEEGMRMKQLLDWAVFLKKDADKIDWPEFYRVCDRYHLRRFAEVATDIAVNLFGVRVSDSNIVTSSCFTPRVVHSTLYNKDYVFSSGKGGWSNRWHIITNLFKYRWKYHLIYNHSVMRQLWWYVIGYIWKTE
jgi:hypothetical protein